MITSQILKQCITIYKIFVILAIKDNIECMASKGSYNKTLNTLTCNGMEMSVMSRIINAAEIVNMNGGNIRSTFCTYVNIYLFY